MILSAALALVALAASLGADIGRVPQGTELPSQIKNVGIDQKINQPLPLDAVFRNEAGREIRLADLFSTRPVILAPVYFECPMLCNMVLNGLLRSIRPLPISAGQEFDIIALSFDPSETPRLASRKKFEYVERYNRPTGAAGWHFLTGDEANIRKVTDAVGFRFQRDPRDNRWAHASGIMVVTPDGRVARYFYGVEYSARDLRFGLVEASKGKVGSVVDQILLYCFHYDPLTGKYGLLVMNLLRAGGILTVLALAGFWILSWRQRKRSRLDPLVCAPKASS